MQENRLIIRMMGYWERIRKDDAMPDFRRNNPAMIEDLWQQCLVLSVVLPYGSGYKYEYLGDKIKEAYKHDITGTMVDLQSMQFPNSVIASYLREMGGTEVKIIQEYSGQTPSLNGKLIKYRNIMLPFGNEKQGVTHIVVGVSCREL